MPVPPVLTALLTAVLSAALFVGAVPDTVPPAAAVSRHATFSAAKGTTITKAQARKARIAGHIAGAAATAGSSVLDYAAAKKHDSGEAQVRRKFAAGWVIAGGRIAHISRAERSKVDAYVDAHGGCLSCRPAAEPGTPPARPDPGGRVCTGRSERTYRFSGVPTLATWQSADLYLNSCETDDLILQLDDISIEGGIVSLLMTTTAALVIPGVIAGVVSGIFALTSNHVDHWQRRSSRHAVLIRTRASLYTRVYAQ